MLSDRGRLFNAWEGGLREKGDVSGGPGESLMVWSGASCGANGTDLDRTSLAFLV